MATYAIGDLQGCCDELEQLLELIGFAPERDRLWLVGDLVNRGPKSAETMTRVMALGDAVITVLGNHDLHLLAQALLPDATPKRKDTLQDILRSPERDAICGWLRRQKLFHYDDDLNVAMVHAGLAPSWTIDDCVKFSAEIEDCLADESRAVEFLSQMYGDEPRLWKPSLQGHARRRVITNYMTRARLCEDDGALNLSEKGAPEHAPAGLRPWFDLPNRNTRDTPVVFGHWSTLRLTATRRADARVYPLDTGAVWGGALTALRLDDWRFFSIDSTQRAAID